MAFRAWNQSDEYGQIGIIESVSLRNFMCHDNLSFDFDPHMNFIIGQNGSGKSAVLTGIILALGGKSGATGRHSNIKGFIKTGKNTATVSVTLKNCGVEAYKPNQYGSRITVERQFNVNGVSNYKIKSQTGQIVSTSKEELNNILTIMDIQIENPITVLTQEISRNFLVSKNSKSTKLFQLFYSGTGLARVEEDYKRAEQQRKDTNDEIKLKKAALPEMKKELKRIKNQLDRNAKLKDLKIEILWAKVIQFEKEHDECTESLQKVTSEIEEIKEKIDSYKKHKEKCIEKIAEAKSSKKISTETMTALREESQTTVRKQNELISLCREKKGKLSRYEREVKKFSAEALTLQEMINGIKLKNQKDENEDSQRHDQKMNVLKEKINSVTDELSRIGAKKDDYLRILEKMHGDIDSLQVEIQDIGNNLQNVEREKQNLIAGLKNRIDVFGPEMRNLLQDVQKAAEKGLFKIIPKGPIGLYLNVKAPEWNFAVQECLKMGMLRTFCCDNHKDAELLKSIIDKHYSSSYSKPSVITTKFGSEMYDVHQYKTVSDFPTVLDMLEIQDPVIANCLIDQNKIENILLVADQAAAVNLMLDNPPRNCVSTYTLTGDQLYSNPYRYYSCRNNKRTCVLKTVNQEDISKKDEELQYLNYELKKKSVAKGKLSQQIKQIEDEKRSDEVEFTKLRTKLRHLQMQMNEEENSQEGSKDINCLENDLLQLLKHKEHSETQLNDLMQEVASLEEELSSLENAISNCKGLLREEQEAYQSSTGKIDEYESKKATIDSSLARFESQLKTLTDSRTKHEKNLQEIIKATEVSAKAAQNVGDRVETQRSPEAIMQILKATEKIQETMRHDQETLVNEFIEKQKKFKEAEAELEKQERICARIEIMMQKRLQEFKGLCTSSITALTCSFVTLLKENSFSGYPKVDIEGQTLEIYAWPNKDPKSRPKKQNLTQLSGGERAYVTIAFLLALWNRIHMPFRILDEYDVFMDSNNRHMSVNLLVNAASADKSIQYIFLSPLELPPIPNCSHVKVHKMAPPKR